MEQPQAGICIICGQEKEQGIRICSELICVECESEIVRSDVLDAKYPFYIHQMRQIWDRKHA